MNQKKRKLLHYFDVRSKVDIRRIGLRKVQVGDFYHSLIRSSWPVLIFVITFLFFLTNLFFGSIYFNLENAIANAKPGYFPDYFFFSVHTLTTIGYGHMYPQTFLSNALVCFEAYMGLISAAMMTGLIFSKFSVPKARVVFSRNAVVSRRDGVPSLFFRMANERSNQVVEAHVQVVVLRDEITAEGESLRRLVDVKIDRNHSPVFGLSWTVTHPLDEQSPFYKMSKEKLEKQNIQLFVSFVGIDNVTGQTIHARHTYPFKEIIWNARFADMFGADHNGKRYVNFAVLHKVEDVKAGHPAYADL